MIKQIDSIPPIQEKETQRERIRRDIQEAIDRGISLFEFEGDYNFDSLLQGAREVARLLLEEELAKLYRKFRQENLTNDEKYVKGFYLPMKSSYDYKGAWISILSRKGETRRRIFCRIESFEEFKEIVIEDCWKSLNEARTMQEIVNGKWILVGK